MIAVSYFAWLVKLDPFAHARSFCDASKDVLLFLSIEIFPPHPPRKIFIGIGLSSPQTNAIKFFYNILRTIVDKVSGSDLSSIGGQMHGIPHHEQLFTSLL